MTRFTTAFLSLGAAALLLAPTLASAQLEAVAEVLPIEKEVSRDATELADAIRTHPDRDFVDTALVFNNTRRARTVVYCTAYDANGYAIGRTRTLVPGNGLRVQFASDFSGGKDFIGSALCHTEGHVSGSVVLLGGAATTDLSVEHSDGRQQQLIRFSLIAHY